MSNRPTSLVTVLDVLIRLQKEHPGEAIPRRAFFIEIQRLYQGMTGDMITLCLMDLCRRYPVDLHGGIITVRMGELERSGHMVHQVGHVQGQPQSSPRRCRVCGCTDADCRQCIMKTGHPCYWVEQDLCSACAVTLNLQVDETWDIEVYPPGVSV